MEKSLKLFVLLLVCVLLVSCGASRQRKTVANSSGTAIKTNPDLKPKDERVYNIVKRAKSFKGTRYKYGGTTKRGMDCSGLIYTCFLEEDIAMPRISREMALKGKRLFLKEVTIGDLLFFETNKNRKVINHVGLVIEVLPEKILFIHSSSSRGVIISSLSESYWRENFVMARRVL